MYVNKASPNVAPGYCLEAVSRMQLKEKEPKKSTHWVEGTETGVQEGQSSYDLWGRLPERKSYTEKEFQRYAEGSS